MLSTSGRSLPGFTILLDVRAKDFESAAEARRAMCEHGEFWERKTVKNIHPFRVCDCFLGMEPSTLGIRLTMGKPRSLATCQIFCRAKQFDTVDLCFFSANMLLIDEQRIFKSSSPC